MVSRGNGNLRENPRSWQEFQDILHWVVSQGPLYPVFEIIFSKKNQKRIPFYRVWYVFINKIFLTDNLKKEKRKSLNFYMHI